MGNTTAHTQYTTSNTSSAPHPSTPHNPNPTAPSNNSPTPNSSPPHEKPSPNSHAPNTPTLTTGWQLPVPLRVLVLKLWQRWAVGFGGMKSGFGLGEKPCWGFDSGERSVAWSAWVYGALVWSGYCAWGGWTGGARWGGCRGRVRWTFRDVLWSVRRELLGINGGLWGVGCVGTKCRKLAVWGGVGM